MKKSKLTKYIKNFNIKIFLIHNKIIYKITKFKMMHPIIRIVNLYKMLKENVFKMISLLILLIKLLPLTNQMHNKRTLNKN